MELPSKGPGRKGIPPIRELILYVLVESIAVGDSYSAALFYAVQASSEDQSTDANQALEEREKGKVEEEEEEEDDENAWQFCKACDKSFTTIQVSVRNMETLTFHLRWPQAHHCMI